MKIDMESKINYDTIEAIVYFEDDVYKNKLLPPRAIKIDLNYQKIKRWVSLTNFIERFFHKKVSEMTIIAESNSNFSGIVVRYSDLGFYSIGTTQENWITL